MVIFGLKCAGKRQNNPLCKARKLIPLTIFSVLEVLAKVHDEDIAGNLQIADLINSLIAKSGSRSSQKSQAFKYVCYLCAHLATCLEAMYTHVASMEHQRFYASHNSRKTDKLRPSRLFKCEPCNKVIDEYYQLELHHYSAEHIINDLDAYAGVAKPLVIHNLDNKYCSLCRSVLPPATNFQYSHHQYVQHKNTKQALDKYLSFCKESNLHPIEAGKEASLAFVVNKAGGAKSLQMEYVKAALQCIGIKMPSISQIRMKSGKDQEIMDFVNDVTRSADHDDTDSKKAKMGKIVLIPLKGHSPKKGEDEEIFNFVDDSTSKKRSADNHDIITDDEKAKKARLTPNPIKGHNVVPAKFTVVLEDLAYHPIWGRHIRKLAHELTVKYDFYRNCKEKHCQFSTCSVEQMLSHVRDKHR